ncbi:MAG: M28 family peptidase [Bacteroidota bacterium]
MNKILVLFLCLGITLSIQTCKNNSSSSSSSSEAVAPPTLDIPRFNRDSAYAYIQKQVDFGPRVPGTAAQIACKDWMASKLESFGAQVSIQEFRTEVYTGETFTGYNVFAQVNPESTNRILFGAHWDSRPFADSPLSDERQDEAIDGADDGASGVGILIEMVRLLAQDENLDLGVDIILFDIEDYGNKDGGGFALGSKHWAGNLPYASGVKPRFGILLDMVGSKSPRFAKERHSLAYAPDLVEKVWNLAGYMGYGNMFVSQVGMQIDDDHLPVNQIAQIPMIDIINQRPGGGFGTYWHTHNDNMEIIDKSTVRSIGKLMMEVIYREDAGIF